MYPPLPIEEGLRQAGNGSEEPGGQSGLAWREDVGPGASFPARPNNGDALLADFNFGSELGGEHQGRRAIIGLGYVIENGGAVSQQGACDQPLHHGLEGACTSPCRTEEETRIIT